MTYLTPYGSKINLSEETNFPNQQRLEKPGKCAKLAGFCFGLKQERQAGR
jgi:hypothetical protein